MRLTGLNVYPVKSTAIRPLTTARVLARGLEDDRSWVVVDDHGVLVSARICHELFTVTADTRASDRTLLSDLRLRAAGLDDLVLDEPKGDAQRVRLHNNELSGIAAGPHADAWLGQAIGRDDLRLMWCDDPTRRRLDPAHSQPGDHTAYADDYPVTIATESSLRQLNAWIAARADEEGETVPSPLPMQRFRPNLVVDGDAPFAEDAWSSVSVGDISFRVAKPSERCVMTTLHPTSLRTGREPVRTLARHRKVDGKTMFAINLIPESTGTIRVGDEVTAR